MAVGDNLTVAYNDAVAIVQAFERNDFTQMEQAVAQLLADLETARDA
jgi:hypothetical protein